MWDLIVSVPDHCLFFYYVSCSEIMASLECLHNKTTAFTTTS